MTEPDHTAFDPDERELEARLRAERPLPSAAFRGDLRRALLDSPHASRPRRLRLLVTAYAGSGLALLLVAAVGLAGAGPLAP
jgi:hypothetical protein